MNESRECCVFIHTCVIQIQRIENAQLYELYATKRAHMNLANDLSVDNETLLWHGTAVDTMRIICHRGFNRSFCGKNGKMFSCYTIRYDYEGRSINKLQNGAIPFILKI